MSERMTGGDAMVQAVLRHGVDTVFGLPGVQTYPIVDALQRAGNRVRMVNSRHEQGSAYMAYGYAKASGRPGIFTVVPGPGVLNTGA
ncbi:MAG: thiamine pyrophosphate-binding protein, partial [Alphaproteobacteria bacterium]|nr:thiamine pyrophosphate-binding protein [Alphaproteobacteria bacterium]